MLLSLALNRHLRPLASLAHPASTHETRKSATAPTRAANVRGMGERVVIFSNSAWNIHNFRRPIIAGLSDAGYEVIAMAPQDGHAERLACAYYPIAMSARGTNPLQDGALLVRTMRALREIRPHAILNFTIKPNIYGTLAAKRLGIRTINNVSGLGTAFIDTSLTARVARSIYRHSQTYADHIFFQNEDDRTQFLSTSRVSRARTSRIPGSGICTVRFSPRSAPRRARPFAFLLIARLIVDKGIREYAEAARTLKEAGHNVEFRLLGPVADERAGGVPQRELSAWVGDGIINYLGEADDVRDAIADADCVVLPSYREGLPRTLLEAASMAKPIVATDVPGCKDVVRDGRTGILCRVRDASSLAAAMRSMAALEPEIRDRMGRAGRERVVAEFDENVVVERYLSALGRLHDSGDA